MLTRLSKSIRAQAVIFDLDGVLMNSEWLTFRIWRELAARYGGILEDSVFSEIAGTTAEETSMIVMQRARISFDIAETTRWAWDTVSERLKTEIDPLPGGTELVLELAKRGIPLAIASNSPTDYIDNSLVGLDLHDFFQVKVGIDQITHGKPAPDVYLKAARQLGALPEYCLAIEDSRVGVQSASSAGMRVLAIPGPHDHDKGFEQAWRLYRSLADIKLELDRLLFWNS